MTLSLLVCVRLRRSGGPERTVHRARTERMLPGDLAWVLDARVMWIIATSWSRISGRSRVMDDDRVVEVDEDV